MAVTRIYGIWTPRRATVSFRGNDGIKCVCVGAPCQVRQCRRPVLLNGQLDDDDGIMSPRKHPRMTEKYGWLVVVGSKAAAAAARAAPHYFDQANIFLILDGRYQTSSIPSSSMMPRVVIHPCRRPLAFPGRRRRQVPSAGRRRPRTTKKTPINR